MNNNYEFLPHELNHLNYLEDNAFECSLFLKREDDSFPLEKPCQIVLIGSGARQTIIGGTGSGAVNVRYKESIEDAFINAGFEISTKDWLNSYDRVKQEYKKVFIKEVKKEAKEVHAMAASYSIGRNAPEIDYEFPIIGDHEVAIYVLSRNAGEGSDRRLVKGDVYLTDTEIRDILYLNKNYKKFLLVLNVPGIVDLSPVLEVKNILLLSQLGSLTGHILVDIVLGKSNPSGKLSSTWAKIEDYPYINTPINKDEARYIEGIYVGYRYFESKKINPLFPFGYGLSYTSFDYQILGVQNNKDNIVLKVNVKNKGLYKGKEVIQVYMSGPKVRPMMELVAYKKSKELLPKESEELEISFSLSDFARYSEESESYILDKGNYVFKVGNSIKDSKDAFAIFIKEDIVIKKVKNVFNKPDFDDLVIDREEASIKAKLPIVELDKKDFTYQEVKYNGYEVEVPSIIKELEIDDLIKLVLGDYKTGVNGMIGQSCSLVIGGAGETTLRVPAIDQAVNMVDGPAGLRVIREYIVNDKGVFQTTSDSIMDGIKDYLPSIITPFLSFERNLKKKGSRVVQITTALPIATALAQSFNSDFVYECGRLVREEMEIYGVDDWLTPAVNIHRHILCGRNFEYYSEDPLVSANCAISITKAIQENPSKVVTIKHFACNNQETNRTNNNSIVSERAIREIYLPAFERCIKESNPHSIMSSYNLIDGIHASEHHGLLIDILRNEWGYDGLVMTDWIKSNQSYMKNNKYPNAQASRNIPNGVNICMPGSKDDIKDIKKALKANKISREELEQAATKVYNFIMLIKEDRKN